MVIRKSVVYKAVLLVLGLAAVIFYDLTMPLINEILKLKINILGFFLEPVLQAVFDISLREAQIVSAWIYLLTALLIFWYFFRKLCLFILAYCHALYRFWLSKTTWQKIGFFLAITLTLIAIGKFALMFV